MMMNSPKPPPVANDQARAFAKAAHEGQRRTGSVDEPYFEHLRRVAKNFTGDHRVVAYLHDTLEDTETSYHELLDAFGLLVAETVKVLTRVPGEPYSGYIRRIVDEPGEWGCIARDVKRADLRDNIMDLPSGHGLAKRYVRALKALGQRV